jgi:hypothetical protein
MTGNMKIRKFNEGYQKKWEILSELRNEVYTAEEVIRGSYNPKDDDFKDLTEINREFNDLIIRLRKFDRLLEEEVERINYLR